MPLRFAPPPEAMPRRSVTRPRRQKERPSPTQRLVHRQADLVPRGRPDAAQALDSARLAGKSVPRTATRARMESPATPRAARASLAGSIASIVRKAARSDRCAPRFAEVRRRERAAFRTIDAMEP